MRQAALFADKNFLYSGDNLRVLRHRIPDEFVDLVYLDPPFKSNQKYNLLFEERDGKRAAAQIQAFEDTWRWDRVAERDWRDVLENGPQAVAQAMESLRSLLGDTDMLAYISMMATRLIELERVLIQGGSLYLHCDPTASHYLKVLLDSVFGPHGFQNEIIWSYRRWPSPSSHFQRMHDSLLFYAKGDTGPKTFNVEYEENSESYKKRFKGKTQKLDPETRTRKITLEAESRGLPRRDVWDISIIAGFSKEREGYPTQKPLALLERIIRSSTNEGDTVLDPFCGCGTTIDAAHKLHRRWIGIDVTRVAMDIVLERLERNYGEGVKGTYEHFKDPASVRDARRLANDDPYQFQWWVLDRVGAQKAPHKKGADKGIDGRLYFQDSKKGPSKRILISVKGGNTGPAHIRDLRGVLDREKAVIGVLVTTKDPTRQMRAEAASAGSYHSKTWNQDYPRLQILTVEAILQGRNISYPSAEWLFKRRLGAEEPGEIEQAEPGGQPFKVAASSKSRGPKSKGRIQSPK